MSDHATRGPSSILVFGGTFDPPHRAHVELPQLAARELGCDQVLYVIAAINPLKTDVPPTPAAHRLAMLRLALEEQPNVAISTIELDRAAREGGPSYTVDTLIDLRAEHPDVGLRLLIGADQAAQFHHWKEWRRVIELAEPAVMLRPPWDEATLRERLMELYDADEVDVWLDRVVHLPQIGVSASEMREALRRRRGGQRYVAPAVLAYIEEHGLYLD